VNSAAGGAQIVVAEENILQSGNYVHAADHQDLLEDLGVCGPNGRKK